MPLRADTPGKTASVCVFAIAPIADDPNPPREPARITAMSQDSLVQLPPALLRIAPSAHGRYVMAIDGGATKTLAAVLDLDEGAVHLAQGGPSNEDAVGTRAAVAALLEVADRA